MADLLNQLLSEISLWLSFGLPDLVAQAPTPEVQQQNISAPVDISLWALFWQAHFVVKAVMIGLLVSDDVYLGTPAEQRPQRHRHHKPRITKPARAVLSTGPSGPAHIAWPTGPAHPGITRPGITLDDIPVIKRAVAKGAVAKGACVEGGLDLLALVAVLNRTHVRSIARGCDSPRSAPLHAHRCPIARRAAGCSRPDSA